MPVPLTQGKVFHVYCEIGIVVSGITAARGAAAAADAPDFRGIAIAHRADNRIVAPEVAGSRPVSHPFRQFCALLASLMFSRSLPLVLYRGSQFVARGT